MQTLHKFNANFKTLFGSRPDDDEQDTEDTGRGIGTDFDKRYGWFYSTEQLADYERVSLDEAWELPVMQALNGLAYLKAKVAHEKELVKQWRKS